MSLTTKEKTFLFSSIEEISKLFNIQDERSFLQQYFSSDEIDECLSAGADRDDHTFTFCLKLLNRKEFYEVFKEYFLSRSKRYKSFYDKMIDGKSSPMEQSDIFADRKENDILTRHDFVSLNTRMDEMLKEIRKLTSVHMGPPPKSDEINENVMKQEDLLTLQRRINELEEEKRHSILQMTCQSTISAKLEEIHNEINIVREGCELLCADSLKMDTLHVATGAILLTSLNNMTTKDKDAESLLQTAIKQGNSLLVEKLLQQSPALINMKDKDGLNPIQIAINAENWIVSKTLLKYNATIVDRKWSEITLRDAAKNGKLEIVEIVLQILPDLVHVKYDDDFNRTLLHYAARDGHLNIVEKLLQVSPDLIHVTDSCGETCLHEASRKGHLKIVEKLLEISPDLIHVKNNDGWTCLHSASSNGHLEMVEKLLQISPDLIHVTTELGSTCLHLASQEGHLKIVEKLLEISPDFIHVKNNNGWTCLHSASFEGQLEIVEVLLMRGANPHLRNKDNKTPRDVVLLGNRTEVAKILQLAENNPRR